MRGCCTPVSNLLVLMILQICSSSRATVLASVNPSWPAPYSCELTASSFSFKPDTHKPWHVGCQRGIAARCIESFGQSASANYSTEVFRAATRP